VMMVLLTIFVHLPFVFRLTRYFMPFMVIVPLKMYLESWCSQRAISPLSAYVIFSFVSVLVWIFPISSGLFGLNIFLSLSFY
jgi:hypothetical protein